MPQVLLRPHILGLKNRLLKKGENHSLGRDITVALLSLFMVAAVYGSTYGFLYRVKFHQMYNPSLPARLSSVVFLAFFIMLLFSNGIAALGYYYSAKDIPLLLTAPVSSWRMFFTRFCQTLFASSWMVLLFSMPATFGFYRALELPWTFLPTALLVFVPFLMIPTAVGTIAVTLFVNIIPPHRIRDLLILGAFCVVSLIIIANYGRNSYLSTEDQKLNALIAFLRGTNDFHPLWLPSRWAADIFCSSLVRLSYPPKTALVMLVATALGSFSVSFLVFDLFFMRGWGLSAQGNRAQKIRNSTLGATIARVLIPFNSQLRAMFFKEAKMFVRDTTQSLQLLMLLMLTFVYLYNFRSLRAGPHLNIEQSALWQVVLAVANIAFGACVISAIATRFVFPAVSLEGRAFALMRLTPLTVQRILVYKFIIWLIPISCLAIVLLVSGSWAIFGSTQTVVFTAILGVAISIGIVGLGIGVGAIYARFDWDSPTQVMASFGSLVYMLIALGLVIATLIPSSLLFVLSSVPTFVAQLSNSDYTLLLGCSLFVVLFINGWAAKHAITAGANHLIELED